MSPQFWANRVSRNDNICTLWSVNDGAARDQPKNRPRWVYINSFEKKETSSAAVFQALNWPYVGLEVRSADLVFLLEIYWWDGVLWVSSRYSIIDRPHGVEREILIGFATSSHYFQELQHLEISSAVQLCFDWLANLYRIKYMTRMLEFLSAHLIQVILFSNVFFFSKN